MQASGFFLGTLVPNVKSWTEKAIDVLSVVLLSGIFILGIAQVFWHILCIVFSVLMVWFGIRLIGVGAKRTAVSFPMNYAVVYLMGPICNFIIILYEIAGLIECFVKGPRDYRDKGGDEE